MKIEHVDVKSLKPWPKNPRINTEAIEPVAKSIQSFGFNVPILCDSSLTIIAGHTRFEAAKKLGLNSVPVIVLPLDGNQREAFAVADNKTAQIACWDLPKLKDIIEQLKNDDFDLSSLGFSNAEIEALLLQEEEIAWSELDSLFAPVPPTSESITFYIKIPLSKRKALEKAIDEYSSANQIINSDRQTLAGLVLFHALGIKDGQDIEG